MPHNPLLVEAAAAASPRRQETFYEVAGGDGGQPSPREAGPGSGAPFKLRVCGGEATAAEPGPPPCPRAAPGADSAGHRVPAREPGGTDPRGRAKTEKKKKNKQKRESQLFPPK